MLRRVCRIGAPVLHIPCHNISHHDLNYCYNQNKNSKSKNKVTAAAGDDDPRLVVDDKGKKVSLSFAEESLHLVLNDFIKKNGFGRAIAANQIGFPVSMIAVNVRGLDTATGRVSIPAVGSEEKNKKISNSRLWKKDTKSIKKMQASLTSSSSASSSFSLSSTSITLANPIITSKKGLHEVWDDCFSFPDTLVRVQRYKCISVHFETFSTPTEKSKKLKWDNLDASMSELLQHEIDHLVGITSFDRLCMDHSSSPHSSGYSVKPGHPFVISRQEFEKDRGRFQEMLRDHSSSV